ncbi:MAG: alanine/glycine:cation symporter family protein [Cytophagales bacterium]|nr:alanine:cation symporter family protein [Bernardetiaceae bacterium]MDW8211594.1 alanine/glycine:cation symporter family protein [Cytophagales bacterium]
MLEKLEALCIAFSDFAWGYHLVVLLVGGGIFFAFYSGFKPYLYLGHAVEILRGKYDDKNSSGEISHFAALSSAIAATVGMGNISGVAVAIATGGPGALFWMWVSAFFGMAIKFFDCTLAVMYRGKDSAGHLQGGPMYIITEGLGKRWKPLAIFFAAAGTVGMFPVFQANQLTQIIRQVVLLPNGWTFDNPFATNLSTGIAITALVAMVIFGGLQRIAEVASRLVPAMVLLYVSAVLFVIIKHWEHVPASFALILSDAFSGKAALGGAVGTLILTGVKRAAFSHEAGIGTAPLAHGAAKTNEPVREGLVAMFGPAIDTLLICTMTALSIIVTGVWTNATHSGIAITLQAFEIAMPGLGQYVLIACATIFALTTLFTYSYFGSKCFGYLFGAQRQGWYNYIYTASIILGAVASLTAMVSLIDGAYALMALPNMFATLVLAPKVKAAMNDYFRRINEK